MKKVTAAEEKRILSDLKQNISDIQSDEDIEALNTSAIQEIYTPETCSDCGRVVSMLIAGKCGYCRWLEVATCKNTQ